MIVEISKIKLGKRLRKNMGDIEGLAASIEEYGLIHPIVVDETMVMLAGGRRLAAVESLGWTKIEVSCFTMEPSKVLGLQIAENIDRKAFTPSEIYEISREILTRQTELASERKKGGSPIIGEGHEGEAKEITASQLGTNRETLRRIELIMAAALENPKKYQPIVDRMDESGNVSQAFRELKEGRREEKISAMAANVAAAKQSLRFNCLYRANHFSYIPDSTIDLIVTDPPYNISTDRVVEFNSEERGKMTNNFGEWDKVSEEKYMKQMIKWSKEFYRVLRPGGSLYTFTSEAHISQFRLALIEAGFKFKNVLVWARPNPKPKPDKTSYVAACDFILFAVTGDGYTFNYTTHDDVFSFIMMPSAGGAEREKWGHPTQKPMALIKKFVERSSLPGDLVLDPFAGSGTTAEVCMELGRSVTLVEKEEAYIKMIEARIGVKHEYKNPLPTVY